VVSVSILSSDKRLECVNELNLTSCSYIHIDVMDGKFVSDKQFPFNEIKAINYVSNKLLDIHLMVKNPLIYVNNLRGYKIEYITFHIECNQDIDKIIDRIHKLGYKAGLAIKPNTDIKELNKYLDKVEMILIMSVEPGKGGQEFLMGTVDRVNYLREFINMNYYDTIISVDGGINDETAKLVSSADIVVVGSYVIKGNNHYEYQKYIDKVE
jgi:ribulose-phosphate 3-epimerase